MEACRSEGLGYVLEQDQKCHREPSTHSRARRSSSIRSAHCTRTSIVNLNLDIDLLPTLLRLPHTLHHNL